MGDAEQVVLNLPYWEPETWWFGMAESHERMFRLESGKSSESWRIEEYKFPGRDLYGLRRPVLTSCFGVVFAALFGIPLSDVSWSEGSPIETGDDAIGYVYAIREPLGGPIKIGWSKDPNRRCEDIQNACPYELRLIGAVPGSRSDEKRLHAALGNHRLHGEWFRDCSAVLEALEGIGILG